MNFLRSDLHTCDLSSVFFIQSRNIPTIWQWSEGSKIEIWCNVLLQQRFSVFHRSDLFYIKDDMFSIMWPQQQQTRSAKTGCGHPGFQVQFHKSNTPYLIINKVSYRVLSYNNQSKMKIASATVFSDCGLPKLLLISLSLRLILLVRPPKI